MTDRFAIAYDGMIAEGREPSEASYLVVSLGGELENWFVGMDDQRHPSILVQSRSAAGRQPPSIKLENLDVQFHIPCKIQSANETINNAICSVIRLNTTEPATRDIFFSVCDSIVAMLGNNPKDSELSKAMRRLAAIFRKMLTPPSKTLSGLFGELTLIHQALLPHEIIRDWREADEDRYDFSSNDLKIEVKSTSTRRRVHEFAFEQCKPPIGALGLVASLFVERAARGTSIRELQTLIEARLTGRPDAILKLREVVAITLSTSQNHVENVLFDLTLATESVTFFDLKEIPAIRDEPPQCVSQVRFVSDLAAATEVKIEALSDSHPNLTAYLRNK